MSTQNINKIIYAGQTLLDLTSDDVLASDVTSGKKFHGRDGSQQTGTSTKDADTRDATATASEILTDKTAYKAGNKLVGTMPNRGKVTGTIATKAGTYTIQNGYHDGTGSVSIDATEQAKIVEGNIKSGVQILGVTGTYSGEAGQGQSKTATPYSTSQTILPDEGYDYLTQVTVNAIKYEEIPNATGITVNIGDVAPEE